MREKKEKILRAHQKKIQKNEKNDDQKEAEKEKNEVDGPMESKNQSDEVKCFDEKERSLIFTNTNISHHLRFEIVLPQARTLFDLRWIQGRRCGDEKMRRENEATCIFPSTLT